MHSTWDSGYEKRAVSLLALGFGLVSVDRFMILPLFPTLMTALKLSYTDLGIISGVLAFAWGLSALFMGNLSDRIGHRKVLIGSLVMFSILVGASGLANGLAGLIMVRIFMGFADGAFTPVSISATIAASHPKRHGFNVGLLSVMSPLMGLAFTPILVTQLLEKVEWRWVFAFLMVPGLLLACIAYVVLREHGRTTVPGTATGGAKRSATMISDWRSVLSHRNPKFLMIGMVCWLTCLIVLSTVFPIFLTAELKTSTADMGYIMSAIGFGGASGCLIVPALSDRFGRKPVMAIAAIATSLTLWLMTDAHHAPGTYFIFLFVVNLLIFGLITMTVGPASAESVPMSLMATSSGLVVAAGEIIGGGIMPIVAGAITQHYGVRSAFFLALGGLVVGFISILFLEETLPRQAVKHELAEQ